MPRKKPHPPSPSSPEQQQINNLKEDVRILKVITELQTNLIMVDFRHTSRCDTQNRPLQIISAFARGETMPITCTCGLFDNLKKLEFYQRNLVEFDDYKGAPMVKPVSEPASGKKFETWKKQCLKYANDLLGLGDLFDHDDPYDLRNLVDQAFHSGTTAKAFIEEAFAEDIARKEHDSQQRAEAAESEYEFE